MSLLEQADAATKLAREAFRVGDHVTGIAALVFAAQAVQLAKLLKQT